MGDCIRKVFERSKYFHPGSQASSVHGLTESNIVSFLKMNFYKFEPATLNHE